MNHCQPTVPRHLFRLQGETEHACCRRLLLSCRAAEHVQHDPNEICYLPAHALPARRTCQCSDRAVKRQHSKRTASAQQLVQQPALDEKARVACMYASSEYCHQNTCRYMQILSNTYLYVSDTDMSVYDTDMSVSVRMCARIQYIFARIFLQIRSNTSVSI